jgi:autotransporter-associated beta strand protein
LTLARAPLERRVHKGGTLPTPRLKKTPIAAAISLLLGSAASPGLMAQLIPGPAAITTYATDPGRPGDPATWRTNEFLRDWGMRVVGAEFAYAAGYAGASMNIGVVDSGYLITHPEFPASRYVPLTVSGGTTPSTPAQYVSAYNNNHGTHVSGTIGAARDGGTATANMHGVAFNATLYETNHRKTDGVLYGLRPANATPAQTLDNAYVAELYKALRDTPTVNGHPIRVITSSWGSQPNTENYNTYDVPPGAPATQQGFGVNTGWRYLHTPEGTPDANGNTSHWINAAIDVARSGVILQFTAGNGGYQFTTPRASATHFLPDLEGKWYTTTAVNQTAQTFNADGSVLVPGSQNFNRCGVAKWACVTAPGNSINGTSVTGAATATYTSLSGTSMAGPHSAAVLVTVMQRFPYMTNEQALYTMFTTGVQNATLNATGANPATPVATVPNPGAGQLVQVPDVRNGWHSVNLRHAIRGPAQLLGRFDVNTQGYSDVWSNPISDVAIKARRLEDDQEAATWAQTKIDKGWTAGLPATATAAEASDFAIGTRREQARMSRVYEGSLSKAGDGSLFLAGNQTFTGGTTVSGGKLSLLGTHGSQVTVNGGTLGGTGMVAGGINAVTGYLEPGVFAEEAASITDVPVSAGNVLSSGGDVLVGPGANLVITVRSATDHTALQAAGDVMLAGALSVDLVAPVKKGETLTIVQGRSVIGKFTGMPEGAQMSAGRHPHDPRPPDSMARTGEQRFRISYQADRVLLIAMPN